MNIPITQTRDVCFYDTHLRNAKFTPPLPSYIRANQIARNGRNKEYLIDISIATWWRWVASGRAPQPIRLSPGTTVWDLQDVLSFIDGLSTRTNGKESEQADQLTSRKLSKTGGNK